MASVELQSVIHPRNDEKDATRLDATNVDYAREQLNEYGFTDSQSFGDDDPEAVQKKEAWKRSYMPILVQQEKKWSKRLSKEHRIDKIKDVKDLCRIGIPASLRAQAWFAISGAQEKMREHPGLFERLLSENKDNNSQAVQQIAKDLERTFPNHPYFQSDAGLEHLNKVLTAFSFRRPEIGYCQSMNFLGGILLLFFRHEVEHAFWTLTAIIENILPPDYYTPTMIGVHTDVLVLVRLLEKKLPEVYAATQRQSVDLTVVCISWFLCLFVNTLPIETAMRVWDTCLLEGSKVLFRVALAIFKLHEQELCAIEDTGMMYAFIKKMGSHLYDADILLDCGFNQIGSLGRALLRELRASCRQQIEQRFAHTARLRSEYASSRAQRASSDN